ncbi:MAG: ISNCY family transposase [Acidobacteria bacterium]|nr:ISNCY family transposase [Acidobacteriota bacterium]MBV9483291.1 ISNCY family transposase [Acidobacteriota bacterium]
MSTRELERVEVIGRVGTGQLKLVDAAAMLRVSYRQAKRLWRRYRQLGRNGLKHGNAGRPSNRGKPMKLRRRVLNLVHKKYSGSEAERFGPTLAAEHLAEEDGIVVDHETLRRWMLAEHLWSRQRKRKKHGKRRGRKEHFGELVQLDGSFHDWLEERGPRGCLMNMVDDATSHTEARMGKEETIWAAVGVLRSWIEKYGVPRALYTDWKNVYIRPATPAEQLRGEVPVTQFGRMCQKLGIRIIAASSPQAKGRVERNHGTHQDRLIKKMRRKGIATYEGANEYLKNEYLPAHNRRFSRPPAKPEDYHGRKLTARELRQILCLETERAISNDWVIRHKNRYLQLQPRHRRYGPTKSKALVCEWEDARMETYYRGERIEFMEIPEPVRKPAPPLAPTARVVVVRKVRKDHPWRRSYKKMKSWLPYRGIATPLVEIRTSASP